MYKIVYLYHSKRTKNKVCSYNCIRQPPTLSNYVIPSMLSSSSFRTEPKCCTTALHAKQSVSCPEKTHISLQEKLELYKITKFRPAELTVF